MDNQKHHEASLSKALVTLVIVLLSACSMEGQDGNPGIGRDFQVVVSGAGNERLVLQIASDRTGHTTLHEIVEQGDLGLVYEGATIKVHTHPSYQRCVFDNGVDALIVSTTTVTALQISCSSYKTYGQDRLTNTLKSIEHRLVDVVGIGDSNQVLGGAGFDHGWQSALGQNGPMFGTGLLSAMENNGNGSGTGYGYNILAPGSAEYSTTLPTSHRHLLDKGQGKLSPHDTGILLAGSTNGQLGLIVNPYYSFDLGSPLRFEYDSARFNYGSGVINSSVRIEEYPWTILAESQFDTPDIEDGWDTRALTLAADEGRSQLPLGFRAISHHKNSEGPLGVAFMNVVNTGSNFGWRYSTLNYRGGQPLSVIVNDFEELSDHSLTHYFERLRHRHLEVGQIPKILIMINSGLNDRNDQTEVDGYPGVSSREPTGFILHLEKLILRLERIWLLNAWPLEELLWVVMSSHAINSPPDGYLVRYRSALWNWGLEKGNVAIIDLTKHASHESLQSMGYYDQFGNAHLTQDGYEFVSQQVISDFLN